MSAFRDTKEMPELSAIPAQFTAYRQAAQLTREAAIRFEARAKASHSRFNTFTTLLHESDEVRLHSKFIKCLLDPCGLHDCGDLFLRLFFDVLRKVLPLDHDGTPHVIDIPDQATPWEATLEASHPSYGAVDILLNQEAKFGVAIENKIWAKEQPRQLKRYADFLAAKYNTRNLLLYLTLDGKPSTTAEGAFYSRVSYRDHILPWLEECLKHSYEFIPINQAIRQYRDVIIQLTSSNMDANELRQVVEFIRENPDVLRYRNSVQKAADRAFEEFLDRLGVGIADQFKRGGYTADYPPENTSKSLRKACDQMRIVPTSVPTEKILPFTIRIENDSDEPGLVVGIYTDIPSQQYPEERRKLFQAMKATCVNYGTDEYGRSRYHERWPIGWYHLVEWRTDELKADLLSAGVASVVERISSRIEAYIQFVTLVHHEATQI